MVRGQKGPQRDVLGELSKSIRDEGIVCGASSHRAEHWWFFDRGMLVDSDVRDPANAGIYGPASNQQTAENQSEPPDKEFLDDWLLRSCEIVDKYRPQVMYFDWWICQPVFQPYLKRFAAYYYNRGAEWNEQVAINFKQWEGRSFPDNAGVLDIERGQSADIRPRLWQTDTAVSKTSWGYVTNNEYKDVGEIVDDLVDIVSKNGTLLLDIGPKADGSIPEQDEQMLLAIGRWLAVNGEAIYGTRPWRIFGEGPTQVLAGSFADIQRDHLPLTTSASQARVAHCMRWRSPGPRMASWLLSRCRAMAISQPGRSWTCDCSATMGSLNGNRPRKGLSYRYRKNRRAILRSR